MNKYVVQTADERHHTIVPLREYVERKMCAMVGDFIFEGDRHDFKITEHEPDDIEPVTKFELEVVIMKRKEFTEMFHEFQKEIIIRCTQGKFAPMSLHDMMKLTETNSEIINTIDGE